MAKPNGSAPKQFDWVGAHARLARLHDAVTPDQRGPEEVRRLLRQRAADLATVRSKASAKARQVDFIAFRLGSQKYAVEAEQVSEVIDLKATVALPGVPSFYLGLVGHGGAVYPLVDIRPLLGVQRDDDAPPRFAVLVVAGDNAVAIAVAAIDGLQRLDGSALAVMAEGAAVHPAIAGTIADSLTVLDLSRLVLDARLTVHVEPRAGALN
jgi:chemotaxis signal transduction protein